MDIPPKASSLQSGSDNDSISFLYRRKLLNRSEYFALET